MTKEDAIKKLKELQKSSDTEAAHCDADVILCRVLSALGYEEVVAEWNKIAKWYA